MSKKNIKTAKPAKALKIEQIAAKDLKPAKYNPRKISAEMLGMLKKNIAEFGLVDPLIINKDMTIIGGHQRYVAAEALGISPLPCIVLDIDKRKEKILNLALNKIMGEFEFSLLADILQELDAGDLDLELAGFNEKDIEEIMNYVPDNLDDKFSLPSGEKEDQEQMTFTLTQQQADEVRRALKHAKEKLYKTEAEADDEKENLNRNGNALYEICREYENER